MEVTNLIAQANALGLAAEAHDKVCTSTCGEPHHECHETRMFIVALVMDRLGLDIMDIGYVADKLLFLQSDLGCQPCGGETPIDEWANVVDDGKPS